MAGRKVDPAVPYTFAQARSRVLPMVRNTVRALDALPEAACPHDEAIGALTLNPEYIAKSYFPTDLLRAVGLRLVGVLRPSNYAGTAEPRTRAARNADNGTIRGRSPSRLPRVERRDSELVR